MKTLKMIAGKNKELSKSVFPVLVGLLLLFFRVAGLEPFFAVEREQAQEAVGYLAQRVHPGDVLYVHASMGEQFKFYERWRKLTRLPTHHRCRSANGSRRLHCPGLSLGADIFF